MTMQRVLILGNGGSGKSTLAQHLGAVTGLPVVHLDVEFWRPAWVEPPEEEFTARVESLVQDDQWIIDGNFGASLGPRPARADTIVFLDLPTRICIWRVVDRALRPSPKDETRPDLPIGCAEGLDDAFIDWVYHFRSRTRPLLLAAFANSPPGTTLIRLKSASDADRWLKEVERALKQIQTPVKPVGL